MVQIRLLGGVTATSDDGESLDVGPAKCQTILAVLALSAGSAVPVSRLIEVVWGEEPPRTADKTLQSYITRLRKGLGPNSISRVGVAYRLEVHVDGVDVVRFQNHLEHGDVESALGEWNGLPLAGLDAEGLAASADGLVEQWLGAVETDLERRIEVDSSSAIGALTELTASYPFREGLWALLMTALYRVGRQADALATYRRAREQLVEHLGVEPGPRLREMESLVLGHDDTLGIANTSTSSASVRPTGTVTFGFCDVEGSTTLWATHPRDMAEAMTRHDELVTATAVDHHGYVFDSGGDSFGVAFHRASDAVTWANELQTAIGAESWARNVEIRLRVGLHTGEADERGNSYFGPVVNVAARIGAAGHGGQTLVSGATAALLDRVELVDLGVLHCDGAGADQPISQIDSGDYPPLRTETNRLGNLPRRLGRLIGRKEDLEVIAESLDSAPVVTLVGPGGIGKTRLALAAARVVGTNAGTAVWLIELAGVGSSNEVARAVAETMNVRESSTNSVSNSIVAALQSRRTLLVLDNCEHVIEGAAALAKVIGEGCPGVGVLATSREGLGLVDERLIPVTPLDPTGPGVELFNERAVAADSTFDPEADRNSVEEICRRLDGVPLAIELAAARTRSLSPRDLLERLDDHLRLLTGGRRTSVERHRTLRATIQWSYELLSRQEQLLFQRLSIFAGPFDLTAAETVAGDLDHELVDVDQLLGGLVDRSMLIVESGRFGRRIRLLETMRQFAAEYLSDSGQTELTATRHAEWCLDELTHIHDLLSGPREIEGVARLGEIWPNVRSAFDWACVGGNYTLCHALLKPIVAEVHQRTHTDEISEWAERMLAIVPTDDAHLMNFGFMWAAPRYRHSEDRQRFKNLIDRYGPQDHLLIRHAEALINDDNETLGELAPKIVAEMRAQGEDHLSELFEIFVGGSLLSTGRLEEHDRLIQARADHHRAAGPPTLLHWTLTMLGYSASFQGQHERAEHFFEQAVGVDVPERTHTVNKTIEARTALRRGQHARAFDLLRSFINDQLDVNNMQGASLACIEFINMMVKVDRPSDAAHMLGYLEATGLLDVQGPAFKTLVADAAGTIAADRRSSTGDENNAGRELDDRQALVHMRNVLDHLLADTNS